MTKAIKAAPPSPPPSKTEVDLWGERVEATFRDIRDLNGFIEKLLPMPAVANDEETLRALNRLWERLDVPTASDEGIESVASRIAGNIEVHLQSTRSTLSKLLRRVLDAVGRMHEAGVVDETHPVVRVVDFAGETFFERDAPSVLLGAIEGLPPGHPARSWVEDGGLYELQTTRGTRRCLVLGPKSQKFWHAAAVVELTRQWRERQKTLAERKAAEERQEAERRQRDHRNSLQGRLAALEEAAERIAALEAQLAALQGGKAAEAATTTATQA